MLRIHEEDIVAEFSSILTMKLSDNISKNGEQLHSVGKWPKNYHFKGGFGAKIQITYTYTITYQSILKNDLFGHFQTLWSVNVGWPTGLLWNLNKFSRIKNNWIT